MGGEYRVGLIIPLQEEYEAVEEVFTRLGDFKAGGHSYYRFQAPGADVKIVAMISFDMGLPSTAEAAQRLIGEFGVSLLAVIGIAGALDDDLKYGDVVVAQEVQAYANTGKAVPSADGEGIDVRTGVAAWRPSAELVDFIRNFRNRDGTRHRHREWRDAARRRMLDAGADPGGDGPDYVVGTLASGDIVSASEKFKEFLLSKSHKYTAVEMEAAGAALAAYRHGDTDLLVVRGISDRAGSDKGERDRQLDREGRPKWRRHAARNAAELLAALRLPRLPLEGAAAAGGAASPGASADDITAGRARRPAGSAAQRRTGARPAVPLRVIRGRARRRPAHRGRTHDPALGTPPPAPVRAAGQAAGAARTVRPRGARHRRPRSRRGRRRVVTGGAVTGG